MFGLDIEVENIEVQLNVFKQEEIARAAVAKANYKKYLEAQKAKNSPDNENELTDLTIELISHQHKDCLELFPMDGGLDKTGNCEEVLSTSTSK
jgi:hypothetical protein